MREIKFRGKRIDNGEWIVGDLAKYDGAYYIIRENAEAATGEQAFWFFEVYPKSVGQFTGLLDKNGKEIYEGDIIRIANYLGEVPEELEVDTGIGVVEWSDKHSFWNVSRIEYSLGNLMYAHPFPQYVYQVEIIGNIYENPELLEEATV